MHVLSGFSSNNWGQFYKMERKTSGSSHIYIVHEEENLAAQSIRWDKALG